MEITLTVGQALWAFILALGIPSAITGFLVWNFERKIAKREAKREKEQEERHKKEAEREKPGRSFKSTPFKAYRPP